MLSYEDALARILALGAAGPAARDAVPIEEADGRVLAEDLTAPFDLPGFDHSSMDGYAVRSLDLAGPSRRLPVRGESRTGAVPGALLPGTAMRIFTGAELPEGADAVVMQEEVTRDGDVAEVSLAPRPGQNVRRRGDDLLAGSVAALSGTRLRPAHLALAGALDRAEVLVSRRPVVAVLGTGDELRRPGAPRAPGTIPESNTLALRAMARRAGAEAHPHPYVRDDREATERAFAAALDECDVLVTVGGVSVGDHDLVRPALEAIGVHLEFWRVAIRPGKPLAVGRFERPQGRAALVLGLPGNPASALVTFGLFGVPLLRALAGDAHPLPALVRARMTHPFAHPPGRRTFARAALTPSPQGLTVTTLGNQASGAVTSMAAADALVSIPADAAGVAAGDEVDVLPLAELGA
jgi:molybdopterin molybdotransferase